MSRYVLKRVLYMIPLLFSVVLVVFLIMSLTPGNPADNILPDTATPEAKAAFNEAVGFTGTLPERFWNYCKGLFSGNVISYQTQKNIFDELALRFPVTLRIGVIAFSIAVLIGVALGILSAVKQYSFIDTTLTVMAVLFSSIPTFFVAMLLLLYFSVNKGMFPSFGLNDGVRSYVLPVLTLVIANIPVFSRMTRSTMLDALNQDYIRTARARGCSETRVIWKHAFKNASLPIITLIVTGLAGIMGGAVITETLYSLPGIGTYILKGVLAKDVPVTMTCALLLAFIFMASMVILDILYAWIDPRIRARYQ
ncbi:MAG: ABC transporter permease [Oscillospiraceae bacterium]|nr:ABC transporter permease [Oscillospiraceae bacterium]